MAAKLIDAAEQRQRDGLTKALAHVTRMYNQGLETFENLEKARMFALDHYFQTMDVETYKTARANGDFDKYEQLMNDPRSGTRAEQEAVMRRAAAHYLADTHLNTQYATAADQEKYAKKYRDEVAKFIDTDGFGDDADAALIEANIRMNLGEKVEKPKEPTPAWALPPQELSDDDPDVKAFRLRDESTFGTPRYNKSHDAMGTKRAADGRIIAKTTLREDADKPKPKKEPAGRDRGDGMTVDRSYGENGIGYTPPEDAAAEQKYETDRHNDAVAAVEANPPTYVDEGPTILPNPSDA
jgi:hypothetical protein